MHKPLILVFLLLSLSIMVLFAQPGSQAQTVPPTVTAPSVYLPVIANFIPTATPTPTSTPTSTEMPSATPTPTNTPSHGGGDTAAPAMVSWSHAPESVDTSDSDQTITFKTRITDNLSGLSQAEARFRSPSGNQFSNVLSYPANRISGDALDGTYQSKLTLRRFSETGEWVVEFVYLYDVVGNSRWLSHSDLAARGLVTSFRVTNNH